VTGQESAAIDRHSLEPGPVAESDATREPEKRQPRCPRCGSTRWVSVSLDTGFTRHAQCVPCGAYHKPVIGPGYKSPRWGDPDAEHPDYRVEPGGTTRAAGRETL
jgi:hypothetical protein